MQKTYQVNDYYSNVQRTLKSSTKENNGKYNIKSIITRSGHTLEFNDDKDGFWGITIKDNENNLIQLSTKKQEITIASLKKITLKSENISISASKELDVESGENIRVKAVNNLSVLSKEMNTEIDETCSVNAKVIDGVAEKVSIQSTKENMELVSGKEVRTNSKAKKIRLS